MPSTAVRFLALVALIARPKAAAGSWVTISDLEFAKCGGPAADRQSFEVENPTGTGKIRDVGTGRCLTLMQCSGNDADLNTCKHICSLSGDHSVIVLDICSDSGDGCDGKSQQWIAHPDTGKAGYGEFESALGGKCVNAAMNPAEVEGFSLIVWNCAFGSCSAGNVNNNQCMHFHSESGQITSLAPSKTADGCTAEDCCLTAKACVAPCSLPMGWGGYFILALSALCSVYLLGAKNAFFAPPLS